jgi:DNA polymerase I-like protein with 3'-5' exonuclease and polymerase domains
LTRNLLILTERRKDGTALSPYQREIFDNVLNFAEKVCGKWDDVSLVGTTNPEKLARNTDADVLLVGTEHAEAIRPFSKLRIDHLSGPSLYGLVANEGNRRIVATPYFYEYGIPVVNPVTGRSELSTTRPSLLGHLYRHLELLKIGLIGWREPNEDFSVRIIRNKDDWNEFCRLLEKARIVAIDSETKSLRRIRNTILTLQFGFDGKTGWVLPIAHPESPFSGAEMRPFLHYLKNYFERANPATHVFANAVFDLHQLIDLLELKWYNHKVWDVTHSAEFQLDENRVNRKYIGYGPGETLGLERLCFEYGMDHYQQTRLAKSDRENLIAQPLKHVAEYGAVDVIDPIRIMKMQRELAKWRSEHMQGDPYQLFSKNVLEVDGVRILQFVFMERNGLKVDTDYMLSLSDTSGVFLKEIRASEGKLHSLLDVKETNNRLLSNRQVRQGTLFGGSKKSAWVFDSSKREHQELLFLDVLGLKPINKGKSGKPKFDRKFKEIYDENVVVNAFNDLLEAKTLYSSFIKGWYKLLRGDPDNSWDNRLRTIFRTVVTGRSASTKPNLQNIPQRKKARAKIVKRQIICDDDKLIIATDYSAHEVRGIGIAARDRAFALSFSTGQKVRLAWQAIRTIPEGMKKEWDARIKAADPHRINYGKFHGVDPRTVTEVQRQGVKGTIFGTSYGMSIGSLGVILSGPWKKRLKEIAKRLKELGSNEE